MSQIIRITSEALQATVRRLLPSQQGFGEDLQASNVIQPIIDLTPTAEGSALPVDLARSIAFGSQTVIDVGNTTTTVANTPGFYRIIGVGITKELNTGSAVVYLQINNGFSTKVVWRMQMYLGTTEARLSENVDFIVFLDTNEDLQVSCNSVGVFTGSVRQVADRYGNIVNPNGFTFE